MNREAHTIKQALMPTIAKACARLVTNLFMILLKLTFEEASVAGLFRLAWHICSME